MSESTRLLKRLADQLPCSRSEAEQYIVGGWVSVDGSVVEAPGFRVQAQQTVALSENASLEALAPVTILLHKPAEVDAAEALELVVAENRLADDRSGLRFLQRHRHELHSTIPLEKTASGLLALTQDWHVNRKLVEDGARVETEYVVEVAGELAPDGLAALNSGLSYNGSRPAAIKVSWQNETRLRFAIKGVQAGQIEHLCKVVGLTVLSVKRIRIGRVPMAALPVGQWRYLLGYERF
ncbi:MAG: rRNA pseudouridine synthase [Burkholderiaceae bacterium]|nr:rRNA pseudouridine synthase [Burkholderiaceae bacterium]